MKKTVLLMLVAALCGKLTAQDRDDGPDSAVRSCGFCDVLMSPLKLTCEANRVHVERPSVTLARGLKISWAASEDGTPWSVTFRHSPCGRRVFDPAHHGCEITGVPPGRYVYEARLKGCSRYGTGSIKVVVPPIAKPTK